MFRGDAAHTARAAGPPIQGERLWKQRLNGWIISTPAVSGDRVYVGDTIGQTFFCLDAETGERLWEFPAGGAVLNSPMVSGRLVFFGTAENVFYALDRHSGEPVWKYETGDKINSSPVGDDKTVYVGSWDGNLYAFAQKDGTLEWTFDAGARITSSPALYRGRVYFGAWDGLAAGGRKRPHPQTRYRQQIRIAIFILVPIVALILRLAEVPTVYAEAAALGFGAAGIGVMALISTRSGTMVHCTTYCPLGLLGNILGKLSPFRVRIAASCTECFRCTLSCRYAALDRSDILKRRPGNTCTLCGDCIPSCPERSLGYRFPGLSPTAARTAFIVLAVSLHTVFLGIARV